MSFDPPPLPPRFTPDQFQVWWQVVLGSLKTELGALAEAEAANAAAIAAQATATAAASAASTAQSTANTAKLDSNIATSWTVPADLVTATDAGSNVTVAVAAHTRIYEDGTQVSVASHNFTGQSYSTDLGIYYDDVTRADTTPTYHITTNLTRAQNNYASGRHRVAVLTTPAAGAPPVSAGSTPPGGGHDDIDKYSTL